MDPNSLLFWYPQIVGSGTPQPRTSWVEIPRQTLAESIDNPRALAPYKETLFAAGNEIGYPLFLRSDQASAKHDWEDTCFVPDEAALLSHIVAIAEFCEMAGIFGLPVEAMVLREFIKVGSCDDKNSIPN